MRALWVSLGAVLTMVTVGFAQAAPPTISAAESGLQLGLTAGYAEYEANLLPHYASSGALVGLQAGITSLSPDGLGGMGWPDLYVDASYDATAGFLGGAASGGAWLGADRAVDADDDNTVIIRLGMGRPVYGNAELIPFVGTGYQRSSANDGADGADSARYQAALIGGGIKLDVAATPVLVVSANAEGYAVVAGTVAIPSNDFAAPVGTTAEERVSLDADYRLTNAWHAFAGLGVSHDAYDGGRLVGFGAEAPASTALAVNSVFGFAYGF